MTEDSPIKTVRSKVVYQNPWITIHEDETVMLDGQPGVYGYMESKDSVMAAVLDEEGRVAMVRGFRYPTKSWGWEFPGGGGEGEEALVATQREVVEETGISADHWVKIGEALVCNGLMTERQVVYAARGISGQIGSKLGNEAISDMRFFTLQEVNSMIDDGEINDNQTITGLFFLQRWLNKQTEETT